MLALPRCLLFFLALFLGLAPAHAQEADAGSVTPPRLSYVDGEVAFWRPGAEDWSEARLNIPLAVGDALYAANGANLELQIGSRDFVRADEETQLSLSNHEPGFLQFKITRGRVSLDLRQLPPGQTVELDTPLAVFRIAQSGYYRLDVDDAVHFITRRGGRATVIPEGGQAMSAFPAEEIVVRANSRVRVETYAAPEPDRWDRWNYARTDELLESVSVRYLPQGVYGAHDLDRHGNWRVVPRYGSVWVPDVPRGWAPYSTGRWIWDPYYEWTWVDDAPWGWAPFHYGRWVWLDGFWGWAPGPVAVRAVVYAPALVAFFWAGHDVSVRIGIGVPGVVWVALGWGEPAVPWWGRPGFRGRAWWGGWHGPRVVNNVVIKETTVVNVTKIVYQNSHVRDAVRVSPSERFGRQRAEVRTLEAERVRSLEHVRGALPVKPVTESVAVGETSRIRPPKEVVERPVVSTRPSREVRLPWRAEPVKAAPTKAVPEMRETPSRVIEAPPPKPKYVSPPKRIETDLPRPEFGTQGEVERQRPSQPPRYEEIRRPEVIAPAVPARREGVSPRAVTPEPAAPSPRIERQTQPAHIERETVAPREIRPGRVEPAQESRGREQPVAEPSPLPGQPASRLFRRAEPDAPDKAKGRPDREDDGRRGPQERRN